MPILEEINQAILDDDINRLEELLKNSANPNSSASNSSWQQPVDLDTPAYNSGWNFAATPLYVAAAEGRGHMIGPLVESGANVNAIYDSAIAAFVGNGIRMGMNTLNSTRCAPEVIAKLIECHLDLEIQDEQGRTLLAGCVSWNKTDLVELLIDGGANVDSTDYFGSSNLSAAVRLWYNQVVNILVNNGADVNAPDKVGRTPALLAGLAGNDEAYQILKQAGADNYFEIIKAIRDDDPAQLEALLNSALAPDLNTVVWVPANRFTKEGLFFILNYAVSKGNCQIIELLLEHGVDPSPQGPDDQFVEHASKRGIFFSKNLQMPLNIAAGQNNAAAVDLLLKHGAEVNHPHSNGRSIMEEATLCGFDQILEVLARHGHTAAVADNPSLAQDAPEADEVPVTAKEDSEQITRPDDLLVPSPTLDEKLAAPEDPQPEPVAANLANPESQIEIDTSSSISNGVSANSDTAFRIVLALSAITALIGFAALAGLPYVGGWFTSFAQLLGTSVDFIAATTLAVATIGSLAALATLDGLPARAWFSIKSFFAATADPCSDETNNSDYPTLQLPPKPPIIPSDEFPTLLWPSGEDPAVANDDGSFGVPHV